MIYNAAITAIIAPTTPLREPTTPAAPAVDVAAAVDADPDALPIILPVELATDPVIVPVDAGIAVLPVPVIIAPVVVAGMAAATLWAQEQTPAAAEMTSTPVRGPQAWRTQDWARVLMAADWEEEHWQTKSWALQETAWAAELRQDFWGGEG